MRSNQIDLYIIAAGKSTRMKNAFGYRPKALIPVVGKEPNITRTINLFAKDFQKIFVVTNVNDQEQWEDFFSRVTQENVFNIPISSGYGDGHALMTALQQNQHDASPNIITCWGDVVFPDKTLINELSTIDLKSSVCPGIIPASMEDNPYVKLEVEQQLDSVLSCKGALFSKHGETSQRGLHDLSVFRFNTSMIKECLKNLHNALWKCDKYITPGGELSVLHSFHAFYNSKNPIQVYETVCQTLSFNTPEELFAIQETLKGIKDNDE
jgi:NDP-sugar pyrophosphorylase family protein